MKYLISILSLLFSSMVFSQGKIKADVKLDYNGPVKTINKSNFHIAWDSCTPQKHFLQKWFSNYNKDGYMIEQTVYYSHYYSPDDTIPSIKTMEKYKGTRLLESSSIEKWNGSNHTSVSKIKYDTVGNYVYSNDTWIKDGDTAIIFQRKYDLAGNCQEEIQTYKNKVEGFNDTKRTFKYDNKGNCIETKSYTHYFGRGKTDDSTKKVCIYNEKNLCVEEDLNTYYDSGTKTFYKYDDKDNLIRETQYKGDGKSMMKDITYSYSDYDKYGNWLKREEKEFEHGEIARYELERTIEYY